MGVRDGGSGSICPSKFFGSRAFPGSATYTLTCINIHSMRPIIQCYCFNSVNKTSHGGRIASAYRNSIYLHLTACSVLLQFCMLAVAYAHDRTSPGVSPTGIRKGPRRPPERCSPSQEIRPLSVVTRQ